jgi:hypothetical protein
VSGGPSGRDTPGLSPDGMGDAPRAAGPAWRWLEVPRGARRPSGRWAAGDSAPGPGGSGSWIPSPSRPGAGIPEGPRAGRPDPRLPSRAFPIQMLVQAERAGSERGLAASAQVRHLSPPGLPSWVGCGILWNPTQSQRAFFASPPWNLDFSPPAPAQYLR